MTGGFDASFHGIGAVALAAIMVGHEPGPDADSGTDELTAHSVP